MVILVFRWIRTWNWSTRYLGSKTSKSPWKRTSIGSFRLFDHRGGGGYVVYWRQRCQGQTLRALDIWTSRRWVMFVRSVFVICIDTRLGFAPERKHMMVEPGQRPARTAFFNIMKATGSSGRWLYLRQKLEYVGKKVISWNEAYAQCTRMLLSETEHIHPIILDLRDTSALPKSPTTRL